jgi:hypothetical protein
MTHKFILLSTLVIFVLGAGSLLAGEHPEHSVERESMMVIALETDDFELAETDVSHLEIGDAETIYTQSGKTIDLLRTAEGIEIYVDGELLETGLESEDRIHEGHHIVHKRVEVECDSDEECEELVWITDDEDLDMESMHGEDHHEKIIIIKEKTESN